ncbi:MAG TPA: exosortase-associated EpsI family protein, partial [Verrucomicrobiae bacterium]|nr:exosortase-associated EpsI family protein [Verrucomicrobiae bacterium]
QRSGTTMNRQKWIALAIVLALVGGAAFYLHGWGGNQKLGQPGIRSTPIIGSILRDIQLPEHVMDFSSEVVPQAEVVTNMLPKDTSLASRKYTAKDGFWVQINAVMMGKDRTSIHKPEYCLPGQGWKIEKREPMTISMPGTPAYDLPAMKWTLSIGIKDETGKMREMEGYYVFWFTADSKLTNSHGQRLWWMMRDLMLTGVLERWSYVSYFCVFPPDYEAAASDRINQFVAASAPEFQLTPGAEATTIVAR